MIEILKNEYGQHEIGFDVRGSEPIKFTCGGKTGDMKEEGISIDTVWDFETRRAYGGCINREEATLLRDFLNKCIEQWKNPQKED